MGQYFLDGGGTRKKRSQGGDKKNRNLPSGPQREKKGKRKGCHQYMGKKKGKGKSLRYVPT